MTDQVTDQDLELDLEEAHDPKNAEAQSIASVAKAGDTGPKAAKRKGDKEGGDKTADKAELAGTEVAHTAKKVKMENADFSEDLSALDALVESEATLSEEFKAKTAVIFEAAVKAKLSEEIDRLEESYAAELQEEVEAIRTDLVEKVDSYLNYVVENWMEENKLAVQAGLRTEIAENFMNSLKDLFTESYIQVPDSKVDLVDEMAQANEELEEAANAYQAEAIKLAEELEMYKRDAVIREAARDLAETQVEKLKSLAEDLAFDDDFASKVATIKESYFAKKSTQTQDIAEEATDDAEVAPLVENTSMAQYLAAIRKSSK